MQKIQSKDKVFIFLDHKELIDQAYNKNEPKKFELRLELFDFQAKNSNYNEENIPRKKRKKKISQQSVEDTNESETININDNDDLITAYTALKPKLSSLIKSRQVMTPMPRFWEDLNINDFPKFKGVNNTNSFQVIDNLIKEKQFLVPPISAFYNYDIADLNKHLEDFEKPFDLIVLDPPWRNKYIRRLKRHHLGYNMLEYQHLQAIPIKNLIHKQTIVAIWCTNSKQHQTTLLQDLLPSWNLRILHIVKWLKLNNIGEPISTLQNDLEQKQPYEMLYIACHQDAETEFGKNIKEINLILSIPSIVHSHKPPLLTMFQTYFNFGSNPNCLELFARYLQPHFTSFGLEVLKLMDKRLFEET